MMDKQMLAGPHLAQQRAGCGQSAYLHANEVAHVVNGLARTLMSCLKALAEPI